MTRQVRGEALASILAGDSRKVKRAGARTLNTVAFDSLPEIQKRAGKDLKFKTNVRRALGLRVDRAKPFGKIEASIWTPRGWLHFHLNEGQRSASDGWKFQGRDYVLVQYDDRAFTKKGRLKSGYRRRLYVVPDNRGALVFYRARRGDSFLIGVLKPKVRFQEDTEPMPEITRTLRKKGTRLFNFYLNR